MIEVTLITGRTIGQGITIDEKCEEEYVKEAAICELNVKDMEKLGIKDGDVIRVSTQEGEVFVFAKASENVGKGTAFMPLGAWVNAIIPKGTDSTGMPTFKGIRARVEPAKGEEVLSAEKLIGRIINED